jgi:hypothetical protein
LGVGRKGQTGDQGQKWGKGEMAGHEVRGLPLDVASDPTRAMSLFLSFFLVLIDWLVSPKTPRHL